MTVKVVIAERKKADIDKITSACQSDPSIEIIGTTSKGHEAISLAIRNHPDVLILSTAVADIPIFSLVRRIMQQRPLPILLIKTASEELVNIAQIVEYGITDIITAPTRTDLSEFAITTRIHILAKLNINKFKEQIAIVNKTGGNSINLKKPIFEPKTELLVPEKSRRSSQKLSRVRYAGTGRLNKLVIIGTSTGGPRLLSQIIPKFPSNFPPVIIIQHMPIGFIEPFAARLNRTSKIRVKQAEEGETIVSGTVYIAPAGFHLEFQSLTSTGPPKIALTDGEEVNFVKPAVDVTLLSASKIYGSGVISVILTGMGHDGRDGCRVIKQIGGKVIALNEKDSDIYGMNKAVIDAGLADIILGKTDIISGIIQAIEGKN
ncbi:MAG: chemotaxis protein CheB [Candidatus Kariarchaeaceae archaeon]